MLTGHKLVRDINDAPIAEHQLAFWWLGQHSFVVKAADTVIYIDPYLTDNPRRRVRPLLRPEEVTNASIICGTHDHSDHIDRPAWPALAAASPNACFVLPELFRENVAAEQRIAPERLVGMDDGASVEIGGVRLTAIASAHEFLDPDPVTGRHPYLGYVIEAGGRALYHSGDSCIYEGLQTALKRWQFDVVFLPINGRDATRFARGCIGNMTYQEAADLAGVLRPGLTVPTHFEMFADNSQDPQPFLDYMRVKYPAQATLLCEHGVRYIVGL